jgi:hypothetical protein
MILCAWYVWMLAGVGAFSLLISASMVGMIVWDMVRD